MKPIQPTTVSQDLLPVMQAFGLGEPLRIIPLGGTATHKWDVTTAQERFVVRLRPAEFADLDATRFDHEVLRRLRQIGFPVPAPLTNLHGTTWFSSNDSVWEVLSWIDGERFSVGDQASIQALGGLLAKIHRSFCNDLPLGKKGWLREDHPDLMRPYLAWLRRLVANAREDRGLRAIQCLLDEVSDKLDGALYAALPHSVIHGDVHPGNVRFRDSQVAALYDFDYLGVQARARDVSDALISFASCRDDEFDPNVMQSLVQPFVPEWPLCRKLLSAYQDVSRLTENEWRALPLLMRSRWIQMRLRGARKVPVDQRIHFVLYRFFEVTDWLDREAAEFFQSLKQDLSYVGQEQCRD